MNDTVVSFMRTQIKEKIALLSEGSQHLFKRMYSHGNLDKNIDSVIDDMPEEKLDHALSQVERSKPKE